MIQPEFEFTDNKARASADTLHIEGKQNYTLLNATYTTCERGNEDGYAVDGDRAKSHGELLE